VCNNPNIQKEKPDSEDGAVETGGFGSATGNWCSRGAPRYEMIEGLPKDEVTEGRPRAEGSRSGLGVDHVAS
jgi:hypothetical protein